jgi:hypothetical protein
MAAQFDTQQVHASIEHEFWDGEAIISFYQRTSGSLVSQEIRKIFIDTLGKLGNIYHEKIKTIKGFDEIQDQ